MGKTTGGKRALVVGAAKEIKAAALAMERAGLRLALAAADGNVSKVARAAGVTKTYMQKRINTLRLRAYLRAVRASK